MDKLYFATVSSKFYVLKLIAQYFEMKKYSTQPFEYHILCMDETTYNILDKTNLNNVYLTYLPDWEDEALIKCSEDRTLTEYCWTVKPPFLLHLLKTLDAPFITFLDADLFPYGCLSPIFNQINNGASIILYPHNFPQELNHMSDNCGYYNAGMITFANNSDGINCCKWWTDRVIEWCYHRHEDGKLADQKYLLDFSSLFDNVEETTTREINVGPWGINSFEVGFENNRPTLNSNPLLLYHFHQFKFYNSYSYVPAIASTYKLNDLILDKIYQPYCEAIASTHKKLLGICPELLDDSLFDGIVPESVILKHIWQHLTEVAPPAKSSIALFGAGKFTRRLISFIAEVENGPVIDCIIDDNATPGQTIAGHAVIKPADLKNQNFEGVFLATDSLEDLFEKRVKELFNNVKVYKYSQILLDISNSLSGKILQ